MAKVSPFEKDWTEKARKLLVGRKIAYVEFMSAGQAAQLGWHHRPIILVLDDGTLIYPSADDEGNDGGSLFTNNESLDTIPSLR